MAKLNVPVTELFSALEETWTELLELSNSVTATTINIVPFEDSWTVAQLVIHVTKSNRAIGQGLEMPGTQSARNPESGVVQLRKMFLDFNTKYQSPSFIVPETGVYEKEMVIGELEKSISKIRGSEGKRHLTEIICLPVLGEISKVELYHFVLYHTRRHNHQLKNILAALQK